MDRLLLDRDQRCDNDGTWVRRPLGFHVEPGYELPIPAGHDADGLVTNPYEGL